MSYFAFVEDGKALCASIMDCSPNWAVYQWREKNVKVACIDYAAAVYKKKKEPFLFVLHVYE